MAGFLGGAAPLAGFDPVMQMPSGVHFSLFARPSCSGRRNFRCRRSRCRRSSIASPPAAYKAKPAKVFRFDQIRDAHRLMESGEANGKIVVRL